MFIDAKGRLFGKVNIIDLVIVLVILGAIGFAGMKFKTASLGGIVKQDEIVMKFYAEDVSDFVADAVKKGDPTLDDATNTVLGNIEDVQLDDAVVYGISSSGQYVKSAKEGSKSIIITTSAKGIIGANGAVIGGSTYGVGHSFVFRAGKTKIWLRVYDIQKKEQ